MSESNNLKRYGYPALIVVSLGVAGYMSYATLMRKPIQEMSDKIESASPFACTQCDWKGLLTARQQAEQQMKGLHVERATTKEGHSTSFRVMTLTCPKCGKVAARVAGQCEKCGEIMPGGVCPKCGWDATAGAGAQEKHEPANPPQDEPSRRRT